MGDIGVKITGIDAVPTSVVLTYSAGSFPCAVVGLDPVRSKLISQDIEKVRKTPVNIAVTTPNGNINFDGWFDGLSYSQSPGGMQYSAVIKSNFNRIQFVYPKYLGVHPSGVSYSKVAPTVMADVFGAEQNAINTSIGNIATSKTRTLVDFLIDILKNYISMQKTWVTSHKDAPMWDKFVKILQDSKYTTLLDNALKVISNIDTSACKNLIAGSALTESAYSLIKCNLLGEDGTTLWDYLVRNLSLVGCTLLVGNSKMFVVPENCFLHPSTREVPSNQQKNLSTSKPNLIYPAQYNYLQFDDNGYIDIRGCVIVGSTIQCNNSNQITKELSSFMDPNAASDASILMTNLPGALNVLAQSINTISSLPAHQNVKDGNASKDKSQIVDKAKAQSAISKATTTASSIANPDGDYIKFIGNWAELLYYRSKYSDRTGTISAEFSPNWCPGTTGTVYSRYNNFWIDFYVDSVTHTLSLQAANSGTATTTINFSSGRSGVKPAGVDSDTLFKYSTSAMLEIQKSFLSDVTGS